jgi:hypothetical protein
MVRDNSLRAQMFGMVLTPNEAERLEKRANDLGISKANVFRRALCPEVFDEPYVAQGRKEGISPRRRTG